MFYGQFVLSKKGPLSKIWLAAHWERKLSKAQIYETNVQDAVDEILKPKVKLSLRTTGHLMLGLVRIYSRKAKYVLADCNEAFLKIKMAFRPGGATEAEFRERERDEGVPEIVEDFLGIPDLDDLVPMAGFINAQYQSNQSHIDQITLNEEITRHNNFGFELDGDDDDFGEKAEKALMEEELEGGRDRSMGNISDPSPSTSKMKPSLFDDFVQSSHLFEDIAPAEELDLFLNSRNGDAGEGIDDIGEPMDVDGGEHVEKTPTPAQESFVLEPLDTATLKQQHQEKAAGRGKRKRRLIVDEPKNISGDDMKANMASYSDTISSIDLAPPTKQLMRMRESSVVDKILSTPGCSVAIQDQQILRLYQSHLVLHARELDERNSTISDVRRDLDLEELDDRYSIQDLDVGAIHSPVVENGVDVDEQDEEAAHAAPKSSGGSAERKRKSRAQEREEEEEEEEDEQVFNRRTKNILNSIAVKLRANDNRILFEDLFTKGSTRRTAAQKFYALLELHKWQAIQVQQAEPFGAIEVFGGERMDELLTSA